MKVFKYKFSKMITALIYVGIVLSVAGFGINIYLVFREDIATAANKFYPILQYCLMFFVTAAIFTILISLLISSYYSIDEKTLKTSFGIIKSKYKLENIESVLLDRTTDKLSIHFSDENFIVIVVKNEWREDFVDALLKANPKIEFTIKSKENDKKDEDKKS